MRFLLYGLLTLILIVTLMLGYRMVTVEPFVDTTNNWPRELSPFVNFDLHSKPYSNNAPFPIYNWWKYGHDIDKYDNCDQYRCQTAKQNGWTARPSYDLTNDHQENLQPVHDQLAENTSGFYHDEATYCKRYPYDIRCPNNWVGEPTVPPCPLPSS